MIQKTGLLGGTFDPVHNGHLALAEAAGDLCNLSEIVLLPAAVPPHKQHTKITDFQHRAAMLDVAVKKKPWLHVSTLENFLPSPSYSIDTLRYLKLHTVGDVEFYFITGADAFLDIITWKEYQDVLASCHFIVYTRDGSKVKMLQRFFRQLGYSSKEDYWVNKRNKKVLFTSNSPLPAISSSDIRERVRSGKRINGLTPTEVADYIYTNRLYLD